MITPYSWQWPAIRRQTDILGRGNFALNSSDTGTGKTICALQTVKDLATPYAIIAPKNVKSSWEYTIKEMDVHEPFGIINSQKLLYNNPFFKKPKHWLLEPGTLLIFDEMHLGCAGVNAKTALITAWAKNHKIKLLAMSATLADSPLKMRVLLYYAGICGWDLASFYKFCRKHGCFPSPHHAGLEFCKGKRAVEYMQQIGKLLEPLTVRIAIEDVPDFPETLLQAKLFDIEPRHKKRMDAIKLLFPAELTEEASTEMVENLRERQRMELYKVPILAEQMIEAKGEGHVPVVFVTFRDTLHNLHKELAGFGPIGTIYGGQPDRVREDVLAQAAQDKFDAIIATLSGGGCGINLQARQGMRMRVSFISPDYASWAVKQAVGRIHRAGGQRSIQTFVMLAGTVEERVYARMKNKLATLDAFNTLEDADLIG